MIFLLWAAFSIVLLIIWGLVILLTFNEVVYERFKAHSSVMNIKALRGIPEADLEVLSEKMYGLTLTHFRGIMKDSYSNRIDTDAYYKIYRHKPTGNCIVMPLGDTLRNEMNNELLKKSGKLN